jgi:translation initiation factor IF-2
LAGKRISVIAKELGVESKAIIDKCRAEGIEEDVVKSHASVVKAGLEASIREWFSTGSATTAVETTQHVDVEKMRAKPAARKKTASKGDDGHTSHDAGHDSATAVATPGIEIDAPAAPSPDQPRSNSALAATDAIAEPPPAPPASPAAHAASAPAAKPLPSPVVRPIAPPPPPPPAPTVSQPAPAAPPAPTEAPPSAPSSAATSPRPAHPPATPPAPGVRPGAIPPRPTIRPAPMNVPTRPSVIAPAGQKLEIKQQVKLAGPKVVRIEAPEQDVRAPRPRTGPGGGSSAPPRGGRGVIPGGPAGEDASSRRNKRRSGPDSAAPARKKTGVGTPKGDMLDDAPLGTGFSEQDLIERENRLARAGGYLKQRRREQRAREDARGGSGGDAMAEGKVRIAAPFTIKELSEATGVKGADIIKKLFMQGVMATINSGIDVAKAQEIMIDFDLELEVVEKKSAEQVVSDVFQNREAQDLRPRAPVVTIMGHVDHGKTSLLDKIRNANVAAGEAGGITQKTSAFRVELEVGGDKKHVVFLDTPGHQAFSEMRSRGANLTDVVVLVVGAPEGVMPQTVESINHAKAAKVPIVVALNKIDSPQATENQIQKIYGQLAEHGLNPVPWGGQTEVVKTSAIKGVGITELLEILDLQQQVLDLKADFAGPARGRVIEATLAEGRGATATILVQQGELKVGDFIVVGRGFGKVRDITDDQGRRLKVATPSMPVQISGIDEVPDAGDPFFVTDSLRKAQEAAEQRRQRERDAQLQQPKVTLDSLFSQMKDASVKEILIVLKADVQGSVDVIKHEIERLSTDEVKVRVLQAMVGGITEADVSLADASKAVIVGFNVIPSGKARSLADAKGVEIRTYQVIYDITEDVKKAASGMLEPEIRQEVLGHAEVRKVFNVSKVGTIAGCYITDGTVQRDALIRVTRNGVVIVNDRVLEQLKRFKDDAKDVRAGMECGMKIVGYDDIKEGDVLECYKKVEVKRTL